MSACYCTGMCRVTGMCQGARFPNWYYIATHTTDAAKPAKDLTDLEQFEKWVEEQGEPDPIVPVQLGWQCPRCGQCYGPFVSKCEFCVPRTVSSSSTSIRGSGL